MTNGKPLFAQCFYRFICCLHFFLSFYGFLRQLHHVFRAQTVVFISFFFTSFYRFAVCARAVTSFWKSGSRNNRRRSQAFSCEKNPFCAVRRRTRRRRRKIIGTTRRNRFPRKRYATSSLLSSRQSSPCCAFACFPAGRFCACSWGKLCCICRKTRGRHAAAELTQ